MLYISKLDEMVAMIKIVMDGYHDCHDHYGRHCRHDHQGHHSYDNHQGQDGNHG